MKKLRLTTLSFFICATMVAGGCSTRPWLMEGSSLTPQPISLVESRYIAKKPLADLTDSDIVSAAKLYARNGAGPLYLVVAHSEISKGDLAQRTASIENKLKDLGVDAKNIVASTVPLTTDMPVALIAFDTLEAQKPKGCSDDIPGLKTLPGRTSDFDYTLGCSVKGYMAKQISNPRDLKGVAGLGGENDGARAANIVNNTIKSGAPRAFLPSYVISTLAGSGG